MMTSYQPRNGFLCVQINCLLIDANCLRLCTSGLLVLYINSTNPGHISCGHNFLSWTRFHDFIFFFSVLSRSLNKSSSRPEIFHIFVYCIKSPGLPYDKWLCEISVSKLGKKASIPCFLHFR